MTVSAIDGTELTILGRLYYGTPRRDGPGVDLVPVPAFSMPTALTWSDPEHDVMADFRSVGRQEADWATEAALWGDETRTSVASAFNATAETWPPS